MANNSAKGPESQLWKTADKLRKNIDALADGGRVVMGAVRPSRS